MPAGRHPWPTELDRLSRERAGRPRSDEQVVALGYRGAVGVAVGLLGVAVYNSGDNYRCDYAILDSESQRVWGVAYATEICDRAERGLPLPPLNYGGRTPGWDARRQQLGRPRRP